MRRRVLKFLGIAVIAVLVSTCGRRSAVAPVLPQAVVRPGASSSLVAPPPVSPANGASVVEPVALAWQPVTDPSGIIAYNWQVSATSTFASILLQNSTNGATADTLSGLAAGSFFWRVQAVSGAFVQGPFSTPSSFTVTGTAAGTLAAPTLGPTQAYSTFHPREVIRFHWTPVTGAITYRLEISNDATFPAGPITPTLFSFNTDNIPTPDYGFMLGDNQGTFFARVFAVNANSPQVGKRSLPSNTIQYTVSYTNPIGPAPVPISPTGGVSLTLPFSLVWHHVPNPQPSGYEAQIASDAAFSVIEASNPQLTDSLFQILTLTAGSKFWRVRSAQGMSSPTTLAETAWSPTQTFTVSSAPPVPVSVTPLKAPLFSGENTFVQVQLSAGVPAAGATVTLASSNPAAAPVPASVAVQGSAGLVQFPLTAGQVLAATPVTLTATLNGVSATGTFSVLPPSLQAVVVPFTASAGALGGGNIMLNGAAPAAGAVVSLASSSPAASPPATVIVPAGSFSAPFTMPTTDVAVNTPVTLTASWNGTTVQSQFTLIPRQPPATLTLTPTQVVGQSGSSFGRVTVATPPSTDLLLSLASSQPGVALVNNGVVIPAGSIQGGFNVFTQPVAATTVVTISVSGAGVTLTAPLTVTPVGTPPPPPSGVSALAIVPNSVSAGGSATGTVTLVSAAATGGTVVTLSSGLPLRIIVPATVTVPAGASSATFTVTTTAGPATSTNISAILGSSIQTAGFLVNATAPPATPAAPTLVSPADGSNVSQPVTLDWNDVTGATSYEVQVSSNSSVSAPFNANPIVSVSQASVTGLPAVRQFWRVRAQNSAGVFGPFSTILRFTPSTAPAAATLNSLALSPTSVVGGVSAQGSVSLTSAAPSGGAVVTLTSANAVLAAVPASVTIAAGATSATFAVATTAVAASSPVQLSAAFAGVTRTATLTVTPVPPPASLSAVSVSPASVAGGTSTTGTVTLTSAAPAGGLVATLTSGTPTVAGVPASVSIPAGASSATFTATTASVTAATGVTLTATLGGVSRSATLTVNPPGTAPLAAPAMLAPAADSRFTPGTLITFDWSDVTGAASYTIQIDDNSSFPAPLIVGQDVSVSQFATSTLPVVTMWWRVRANSSTGVAGTWSAARRFEVK